MRSAPARCLKRPLLLPGIVLAACGAADDAAGPPRADAAAAADYVLLGGEIYTVDPGQPRASAVAVRDDQFVFVGDDEGAQEFIDDSTRVADLDGRMVIPGIIDSHTHPGYTNLERYGSRLPDANDEDFLAAVQSYARENPDLDWLRLCCWPVDRYVIDGDGPHKRDLDVIVANRPVWIGSSVWHSVWLNSKALEILGIDENTPNPRSGVAVYARDNDGEPTGWVKEGAAWQHLAKLFEVNAVEQAASIEAFLETLRKHGVTTVYDAGNFGYEDHVYEHLARLEKEGRLAIRYEGTYQVFVPGRRHHAVEEMKRLQASYGGERLRFRTIKLFMDGVLENRSGALLRPYADDPDNRGGSLLSVAELRDFLLELHDERFDLHIHAIGDRAVRDALDAVEAAKEAVGSKFYPRVTLAHLHYVDAAELARFGELGVSANFTPHWLGFDGLDSSNVGLGPERAANTYLARSIFETGGNVTFSSDTWGLGALSPFLGMHVAHNRQYPADWIDDETDATVFRPPESEKLDIELLIRGYTINGAYPFRMDDRIGSIEAGKLADLVVLGDDLFDIDGDDIHEVKPAAVMMEGAWIHGAAIVSAWSETTSPD